MFRGFSIIIVLLISGSLIFPNPSSAQPEPSPRPKVGLVLSGGGAKGLAHVGVLKVLEEAGIRPDFIAGTSMGSIVGGLYAIGYSADSIERIAKTSDWNTLLSDNISRRLITLEEKEDFDRFIISFPIKENKIALPSGVVNGLNVVNRLNTLFAPVYMIDDFSKLPIPFLCIATDLETGKEVVLRNGYLPDAIRASMSIPSVFNPVIIDNRLLMDGGVINNFPVIRMKEMGADIIIGVDVGFQTYRKEELNSLIRILEQTVFFYGDELNRKNRALCNILVEPDIKDFNASSFGNTDSIIARGEKAARLHYESLKRLADSLRVLDADYGPSQKLPDSDSLYITEVIINGLEKVSPGLVSGKLQIEVFDKVTPVDISNAVERLYASLYFDKVSYSIQPASRGVRLIFNLKESSGGQFRFGMHYDSNYKSSLLLNATFRNFFLDGSKLSISSALGDNPFFHVNLFKNNGWKPGYGYNFLSERVDVFVFNEGRKISALKYFSTRNQIFIQSIFDNSYSVGAGLEYEAIRLRPEITTGVGFPDINSDYFNYYFFLNLDSYDNGFYPKRGIKLYSEVKLITNSPQNPAAFHITRLNKATSLGKKVAVINHLYAGFSKGDSIPYQYQFYTGGLNPSRRNGLIPFTGMDFMERSSLNALVVGMDLQIEFFPNVYGILKGSAGNLTNNFSELFAVNDLTAGYGVTLGYQSLIGPIELSLMKPVSKGKVMSFINIGFWF
jgi:NTE family protein